MRCGVIRSRPRSAQSGILAGAVARGVADDVIASFDLVIVDEFDQFVVVDETDRESSVRYAELWQRLVRELPAAARYLVKSATLGLASQEPKRRVLTKAQRRSALIGKLLNPVAITVPEQSYAAVIPFKPIRMSRVHDGNVAVLLDIIAKPFWNITKLEYSLHTSLAEHWHRGAWHKFTSAYWQKFFLDAFREFRDGEELRDPTRNSDGKHHRSSPSTRDGIWRCAMPMAPRHLPSLPQPIRVNPPASANSGLDKT